MTTMYDETAIARGEAAICDAEPLARELAATLDDPDADARLVVATAHDLALTFERISLYLHVDGVCGADEYKEAAHADLFEALDDAADNLWGRCSAAPYPIKQVRERDQVTLQTYRDALDAYWPLRVACLGYDTNPASDAENEYTVIGYWQDDERVVAGVIKGSHDVTRGEGAGNGGPWADTVTAPDAESAECESLSHCLTCENETCRECDRCSECGECECPTCQGADCGECLGCHPSGSDPTRCEDCATA